jgi:CHAT domain-containing protein
VPIRCSRSRKGRCILLSAFLAGSLAGCRSNRKIADDPAAVFQSISAERHTDPPGAAAKAQRAYKDARGQWVQRFRLLYADILIEQSKTLEGNRLSEVKQLLAFAPQDAEARLRQMATQAYLDRKTGDFAAAREINEKVLAMGDSVGDPCWSAEVLLHYFQTLLDTDRDGAGTLAKARPVAENCSDPYWLAVWYLAQGNLYYTRFRFEQAKDAYEVTLHLAESHKLPALIGLTRPNLASAYNELGDSASAVRLLAVEPSQSAPLSASDQAHNLALNAAAHYQRNEYEAARAGYQSAIDLLKRSAPSAEYYADLDELAAVLLDMNRLTEAGEKNQEVIDHTGPQIDPKWIYPVARLNFAALARMRGDPGAALRELSALEPSLKGEPDPEIVTGLHSELAQTWAALGRKKEAEREFRLAVATASQVRSGIFSDWNRLTYSVYPLKFVAPYVDFRITEHDPVGALQLAETFRAQQLAEKLHFNKALVAAQFQGLARARQAVILSYWITAKRSYLWVTNASETRMFPLAGLETLGRDIATHNSEIANSRDLLTAPQLPAALYEKLVAPAEAMIPDGSNVIIVPDGPLATLNFETLIPPARPARFWLNKVSVTVAPSLAVLQASQVAPQSNRQFLLVGGTLPTGGLKPLPDREIQDIQQLFPTVHTLALEGANATPQRFLASSPGEFSLLHISAHAFANRESPLDSYIALTPDPTHSDGRLYAHDLKDLILKNDDLVTLSVCEGAGGKSLPGEGLIGLTWALLSTGTRSVVAGLWKVSDTATAEFMRTFYYHLSKHEDAAKALHDAKIEMASKRPSPYYWAAFQLYTR